MDKTNQQIKIPGEALIAKRRKPGPGKKDYSGSRWAGLILLIITFIVSLFFYARGGLGDFFSSLLGPARYSIRK